MRVTNNVLVNNMKRNLTVNIRNMEKSQMQLATGRRINKPADDPTGIVDSLRLKTRLNEIRQFQANVDDALSWLETTDYALNNLGKILNRVYELTVYGANGSLAFEDRKALADEVGQLISEVKSIANTAYGDRYIFGGSNTTEPPYDLAADAWNPRANNDDVKYEIGVGIEIPVNTTAHAVFLKDDPDPDKHLLNTLKDIFNHLQSGDTLSLGGNDIVRIKANINQVLSCRAQIGARVNRLEMTKNRLAEQEINFTGLQSEIEGADPAKVIMDLKNQENVYRSALAVGARVMLPTLMDFIR
jgi:flagellar hook-associated protein 3 FlgL